MKILCGSFIAFIIILSSCSNSDTHYDYEHGYQYPKEFFPVTLISSYVGKKLSGEQIRLLYKYSDIKKLDKKW